MFSNENHIVEKEYLQGIGYSAQSEYLIDKFYRDNKDNKIERYLKRSKDNDLLNSNKAAGYKLIHLQ